MRKINVMLTPLIWTPLILRKHIVMRFHLIEWAALVLLGLSAMALPAQGANFDCGKAGSKVEHIICDNPEISKLDDELNAAYKAALQDEKQADSIKQVQKQWLKVRNGCTDAGCVKSAYEARLPFITFDHTSSDTDVATEHVTGVTPDRPGYFKLDKSTNDKVCSSLSQIINSDIQKYGRTKFETHNEFVKWLNVPEENIVRGVQDKYTESVERVDADINNDGVIDQVIRTRWSIRYVLQDALDVLPLNQQQVVIDELLNTEKKVEFNTGNYWLDRYRKKYDLASEDWWFGGVASLNLYKQNGAAYLVAQNYAAPPNVEAKIYVFQIDKEYRKHEEIDVCMFVKICPCGGCIRMSANQAAKTLPAKKWCQK